MNHVFAAQEKNTSVVVELYKITIDKIIKTILEIIVNIIFLDFKI